MATILKPPPESRLDQIPAAAPEARGDLDVQFFDLDASVAGGQNPIKDPDDVNPLPIPERIIVRELTVAFAANGPFVFARPDQYHPCNSLGQIDTMLDLILANNYDPRPDAAPYFRPLDLNLGATTCFIFKLADAVPWRFNRKELGATLGKFMNAAHLANYYKLRHVMYRPGQGRVEQATPFADHADFCRLIYFIAKPPIGGPFAHPFNLNVEFVYSNGPQGEINTLPIVIDPDIRYPGGSGA